MPVIRRGVLGNVRANIFEVTGPASYAAGGFAVSAAEMGMNGVDMVLFEKAGDREFRYDYAAKKVVSYEPGGAETAGATDLSGVTVRGFAFGH